MQISDLSLNKYILPYFSQKKILCQLPLNIFAASKIKSFQTALSENKSSYCARLVIFLSYKCYQQKDLVSHLVLLTTKNSNTKRLSWIACKICIRKHHFGIFQLDNSSVFARYIWLHEGPKPSVSVGENSWLITICFTPVIVKYFLCTRDIFSFLF